MDKKERQIALELLNKRNVVAVGHGIKKVSGSATGRPAIIVSVKKKVPLEALAKKDRVPAKVKGRFTDVVDVGGEITLRLDEPPRRSKGERARTTPFRKVRPLTAQEKIKLGTTYQERPARPGCSIGHKDITAGTLGAIVYDIQTGQPLILSNNHVLANVNRGKRGDNILQPGPYDGGREPEDVIAQLDDFININMINSSDCPITNAYIKLGNFLTKLFDRHSRVYSTRSITNKVDCALAVPIKDDDVSPFIPDIGSVTGVAAPDVGMEVVKRGRTTKITTGKIESVDNIVNVNMGDGDIAIFEGQMIISGSYGMFSAGGDSGSLILDKQRRAVGLLFAGNDSITIGNDITNVLEALGVSILQPRGAR